MIVTGFDWTARAYQSAPRKRPHIRRWAGALFRTPPFSLCFLPISPPPLLPSSRGGSSSRSRLPKGWVQGDWIRSTITEKDLDDLDNEGLIPHGSARLPGDETELRVGGGWSADWRTAVEGGPADRQAAGGMVEVGRQIR